MGESHGGRGNNGQEGVGNAEVENMEGLYHNSFPGARETAALGGAMGKPWESHKASITCLVMYM